MSLLREAASMKMTRINSQPMGRAPSQVSYQEDTMGWNGPTDPDNPFNWPVNKKRIVTFLALLATFTTLINGTVIAPAHDAIGQQFRVSDAEFPNSYWPISTWAVGGATFSIVLLPLMEDFGVRPSFLGTYFVFICLLIPQGLAQSFTMLCVFRFFAGGCVSVLANTSAGVIGNVWSGEIARTVPVSLYITALLTGSSIGPVIGGLIMQFLSWRWISYIQLILHGVLFPVYVSFFQESRGNVILRNRLRKGDTAYTQAEKLAPAEKGRLPQKLLLSVQRPLVMLFTEPVVFLCALWSAFTVGMVYTFTQSVEQVFRGLYGWDVSQACYVQAAIVLGQCCGWSSIFLSRRLYVNSASRNTEAPGVPIPEGRLYTSVPGTFLGLTAGLFVYAWTSYASIPWIVPAAGTFLVGCGTTMVTIAITDYIVDAYTIYAGSCVAAVVLGENMFAAFLPFATQSMYEKLGYNWASTTLGFIALFLSFFPILILVFGRKIRARSPFMKLSMGSPDNSPVTEHTQRSV